MELDHRAVLRRLRFAQSCRYNLDLVRNAIGFRRRLDSFQWFYYALTLAFDLTDSLRPSGQLGKIGRAQHAALLAPIRLNQDPHYRAYWYDPRIHALVGVLLGLDLHRQEGRYHLLESNLTAGLMKERRALYQQPIDPFIIELVTMAKKLNFKNIVLLRRSWPRSYQDEFSGAGRASNIHITAVSVMKHKGDPLLNPVTALPIQLTPDTMYVVCTATSDSPIFEFLHNKRFVADWFSSAVAEAKLPPQRLAALPTYDEPPLSDDRLDARWPNLVIKLANSDEGKDVLMGRFESLEQAREALGLSHDGRALPVQFRNRIDRYWIDRLFPGALTAIYQPFVPPEVVDGFPRMIRMEVFISPMGSTYLSAHATIGGQRLPERAPSGIVLKRSPYDVSVPPGRFVRLPPEIELELNEVAREFGELADSAIRKKFVIYPAADAAREQAVAHAPDPPTGTGWHGG
jgi:hypothetical protein